MIVAVIGAKLGSYLPFLLWTIVLLIGGLVASRYYREANEDDEPLRDADLLTDLEQGDAASKMTEAEFHRVRDLLLRSETERDAKTRSKNPARPKPERAAATLNQEESSRTEVPERREEDRQNGTEMDGEHDPPGGGR